MRRWGLVVAAPLILATAAAAADDPLARARELYNRRDFAAALAAADQAHQIPSHADAADLVAARIYLERFRDSASADDLDSARERLRRLSPERFAPGERTEYVIGLGEALFLEGAYGAAATLFDSVLQGGELMTARDRDQLLDWWASSLDRDTRVRPEMDRQVVYGRIRARLEEHLRSHPGSGAAAYWLASAARSQGDLQGAWDAAQAGWVRAPLAIDHGAALRADLDRLVLRVIIPDRAKLSAQPPESLRAEWERFKSSWTR